MKREKASKKMSGTSSDVESCDDALDNPLRSSPGHKVVTLDNMFDPM